MLCGRNTKTLLNKTTIMKRIFNLLLLVVAFVAFSTPTFAQDNKQRKSREQMVEAQAQHIAKEMAFDDATSARFVKTFCEYQKEVWALGPRQKPQHKGDAQAQSDAAAEKAMKERFAHSQKILDLREKYYGEYSKFLTQKQIQRVYQLERQMMQRLSKQRMGNRQGGGKPMKRPNK